MPPDLTMQYLKIAGIIPISHEIIPEKVVPPYVLFRAVNLMS
jgi:hypothetical protein